MHPQRADSGMGSTPGHSSVDIIKSLTQAPGKHHARNLTRLSLLESSLAPLIVQDLSRPSKGTVLTLCFSWGSPSPFCVPTLVAQLATITQICSARQESLGPCEMENWLLPLRPGTDSSALKIHPSEFALVEQNLTSRAEMI